MKKLFTLILFIVAATTFTKAANEIDSLKQKLQLTTNDTLKGAIYAQIADQYSKYDTIVNRNIKAYYQTEAIHYNLLALHNYSFYEDTTGIKLCFDKLAKVYQSKKNYSQAKWFILQSNNISRIKKDVPNIITSLIRLANVKMDIKEYKLAMRDLNEALNLSVKNKIPELEAAVQKNYAFLYNRLKDYEKGDIALKRSAELEEEIKRNEELKAMALQTVPDTAQTKKVVAAVVKKKTVASAVKKNKKANTVKKLASL